LQLVFKIHRSDKQHVAKPKYLTPHTARKISIAFIALTAVKQHVDEHKTSFHEHKKDHTAYQIQPAWMKCFLKSRSVNRVQN